MPRLHHLALRTHDVTALAAFYGHWLGLRVVRADERSHWLAMGAGAVLMIERAEPGEPGIPPGSMELFAVCVSGAERVALRARLLAIHGLEAETPHTLYFRDPDGRRVGVSSYPFAPDLPVSAS